MISRIMRYNMDLKDNEQILEFGWCIGGFKDE
jgi:hypothetical protein